MKQTQAGLDLFELLSKDHDRISDLFDEIEEGMEASAQSVKGLFILLSQTVRAHLLAEQEIVYSALKRKRQLRALAQESLLEHEEALRLVSELNGLEIADEEFEDTFQELKEAVEEHVRREEEETYREMREAFDQDDLRAMAESFQRTKQRVEKELRAA